jgi:hypothetical protein
MQVRTYDEVLSHNKLYLQTNPTETNKKTKQIKHSVLRWKVQKLLEMNNEFVSWYMMRQSKTELIIIRRTALSLLNF